jgi:hypothetical protein
MRPSRRKNNSMQVMSYNARGPVLVGINKTKCAALVHAYDPDIILMQNVHSDGLDAAINDRYLPGYRDKDHGLAVYRRHDIHRPQPTRTYRT